MKFQSKYWRIVFSHLIVFGITLLTKLLRKFQRKYWKIVLSNLLSLVSEWWMVILIREFKNSNSCCIGLTKYHLKYRVYIKCYQKKQKVLESVTCRLQGNYNRLTDRPTNKQTDIWGYIERVTLPMKGQIGLEMRTCCPSDERKGL